MLSFRPANLQHQKARFYSSFNTNFLSVEKDVENGKPTGVVTVSFNSPKNLNALTEQMGDEFASLMKTLSTDTTIRALILTGQGRAFSAGGDLKFLRARTETPPAANSEIMRKFYARFLSIRDLPFPTVAAINGHAVGAGAAVSLACDLRLIAQGAKFGLNFVKIGLTPGMASSHTLLRLTNPQVAARMILTGDLIDANEAKELGIVLKALPQDELLPEALALARKIASASPIAVRAATKTLRLAIDDDLMQLVNRARQTSRISLLQQSRIELCMKDEKIK
ncbi:hypothetical protein HDU76_000147 [Blyttiomyces sp. JEL0837]|nr:hypothetical protein HDU76_000147 [Blyttiomyces sp. JEL0837]